MHSISSSSSEIDISSAIRSAHLFANGQKVTIHVFETRDPKKPDEITFVAKKINLACSPPFINQGYMTISVLPKVRICIEQLQNYTHKPQVKKIQKLRSLFLEIAVSYSFKMGCGGRVSVVPTSSHEFYFNMGFVPVGPFNTPLSQSEIQKLREEVRIAVRENSNLPKLEMHLSNSAIQKFVPNKVDKQKTKEEKESSCVVS